MEDYRNVLTRLVIDTQKGVAEPRHYPPELKWSLRLPKVATEGLQRH